jgi:hypothetical protein
MRKIAATVVALGVVLAGAAAAQATVTESVDFTAKYVRKDKHKKYGGLTLRTTFRISDSSGGKPPVLTNTTFRFPKGSVVNAKYFKKCSPAKLQAEGVKGCPSASKIGAGKAQGDARPIVADPIDAKITLFNGTPHNGQPTIVIYAVPELSSPLTILADLVRQRGGNYGYVLDADVPPIPTLPGQPNASVSFFDATTIDRTVRRRGRTIHYIEAPVLCTGTYFLLDGSFSYEGGITNTVYERFSLRGGPRCP